MLCEFAGSNFTYAFNYDMLNAVYSFAQQLRPQDYVALMTFDMRTQIVTDFTQDKRQIFDAIRTLNRQDGLTVLIVEQNANHALRLAHRGYVMVNGLITLSGTGGELLQRPEIRAAYLEGGRRG